ncbi:hypothetical protein [Vacuolonema iberomarrocanum]|uniref:hypothetical protein n=1 Tax=Vacuolonema iberomarrocanum TaxID=3454632 RepID=UPI0019EEB0BD|nr:hypothetical protein [filamentous cyanobacterium LEGE 07170]
MKREIIQDFLNLPGIAGVALMDGRSRPYFFGVDQTLNFQQKEALAQGIQQVVDTTPNSFGTFEFQFVGHQVFIYKLQHGIILLVLTGEQLVPPDYHHVINVLCSELQEDAANAIATFRLFAGNLTVTSQNNWAQSAPPSAPLGTHSEPSVTRPKPDPATRNGHTDPSTTPFPPLADSPDIPAPAFPQSEPTSAPPTPSLSLHAKDIATFLSQMSQIATHYLGNTVVANYWKSTRPDEDWLSQFQIDRSAQFSFQAATPSAATQPLSEEQQQWVRAWIAAFISRCSKVIRDFSNLVQQSVVDENLRALLSTD